MMKNMTMPLMPKMEVPMFSDDYLNNPDKVKERKEYCDVIPIDMNKGYVPVEKDAADTLKKVEENIKGRFSL